MKTRLLCIAAMAAAMSCATTARAIETLAYSFESPAVNPDGFGPNGGGVTITQDTIGATQGTHSLKATVVGGATFVGALSGNVDSSIGDPPGVNYVLADVTLADAFVGGFAVIGVTVFGASQPDYPGGQQYGLQSQFADFEHLGGKAPGTYSNVRFDLTSATHPLTFASAQSFNQIFGTVGSGPNDVIPTGFQFFLNKSNDAPLTVYIDNVRIGRVPEPASMALATLSGLALMAFRRRAARTA